MDNKADVEAKLKIAKEKKAAGDDDFGKGDIKPGKCTFLRNVKSNSLRDDSEALRSYHEVSITSFLSWYFVGC